MADVDGLASQDGVSLVLFHLEASKRESQIGMSDQQKSAHSCVSSKALQLPALSELGLDLLRLSPLRITGSLVAPFFCTGLYVGFASIGYWPFAILALIYLSFITYGSISHDLVHRNFALPTGLNDLFLSLVELLAIRSGHAYRFSHLYHHRRFPDEDDIEGAASKMKLWQALADGVTLQIRIYRMAMRKADRHRNRIILEGIGCVLIITAAIAVAPWTFLPIVYVVLMIMGSWIIPLITSYIPHDPNGATLLTQTRHFRGVVLSIIALEHLYHLEHHLYPSVPHQNWPRLAKRLDPYFRKNGLKAIRLWF